MYSQWGWALETHEPSKNSRVLAAFEFEAARADDIDEAHALVERLIGPPIASPAVIRAVQAHSHASMFVRREDGRIVAALAELPLVAAGLEALLEGRLNGLDPDLSHIARPGDLLAAHYCWALAADSIRASAIGIKALLASRTEVYGALPFFARTAPTADGQTDPTSDGARVAFRRFGCSPYPGQPTLLYAPVACQSGRSAA